MARINIEDELFSDPRFKALISRLGDEEKALGRLILIFRMAQKYWNDGEQLIPADIWDLFDYKIIELVGFAIRKPEGIYIKGSAKYFDWYQKMVGGAQKGGKKSAEIRQSKHGTSQPKKESFIEAPSKPPRSPLEAPFENSRSLSNALTLTPTLALTLALTQKEEIQNLTLHRDTPSARSGVEKSKRAPKMKKEAGEITAGTRVWEAYSAAYEKFYGHAPARNARDNSICAQLASRIGADEAPKVAEFYLTHHDRWYTQKLHPLGILLSDCQKLRTEWLNGVKITGNDAKKNEIANSNRDAIEKYLKKRDEINAEK